MEPHGNVRHPHTPRDRDHGDACEVCACLAQIQLLYNELDVLRAGVPPGAGRARIDGLQATLLQLDEAIAHAFRAKASA